MGSETGSETVGDAVAIIDDSSESRLTGHPLLPAWQTSRRLPSTAILLCTHNGEQFLADQLNSYIGQHYSNWHVWVSDDGSTDQTLAILRNYRRNWQPGRITITNGPCRGFAANFLSLACNPDIKAEFFAFSDQDDVWEPEKLLRAVGWLENVPRHIPALYCSRTRLVDVANKDIGLSPMYERPPGFANALTQSIGGGNTIMFNQAARALLQEAGPDVDVQSHDTWLYLLVSGCGGKVFWDPCPTIRYRQHGSNLVGSNISLAAKFKRAGMLAQGWFRQYNDRYLLALQRVRNRLISENRQVLDAFAEGRNLWLLPRLLRLRKSGIHRQTLLGNFGLVVAAIFKKI